MNVLRRFAREAKYREDDEVCSFAAWITESLESGIGMCVCGHR